MSKPSSNIQVDIVIFGSGIAGLWLLNRLQTLGYSVLLLEANTIGKGQTICAQGIIHGGTKYAVKQRLTAVADSIARMPAIWRSCLQGQGELDLSQVRLLAEHQHLWVPGTLAGKFVGFLTAKAMRSRVTKVTPANYPSVFTTPHFNGEVYALDEPVLDVSSLLHVLAAKQTCIRQLPEPANRQFTLHGQEITGLALQLPETQLSIKAQRYIFTAGAGNADLLAQLGRNSPMMQKRPLHMLMLKGMPAMLYAHAVDSHFKPQLTITSHHAADGTIVWYLGGELSVRGVQQTPQQLFASVKQTLKNLLPDLNLTQIAWRSLHIDRAEPWQAQQTLPDQPSAVVNGNLITAWPVKLAFTPLLAQQIIASLHNDQIMPHHKMPTLPDFWSIPAITPLPWLETGPWNTEH